MDSKTMSVKQFLWATQDKLKRIRSQIDEIRPMKKTNGYAWWLEYGRLKEKECIAEQDEAACKLWLSRHGNQEESI